MALFNENNALALANCILRSMIALGYFPGWLTVFPAGRL